MGSSSFIKAKNTQYRERARAWKHENFDDFLKEIGMGMIKRKVAVNSKPHISFLNVTDQGFHWVNDSITKEEKDFVWGQEQPDKAPTGDDGTQVWVMEGDKMV